MPDRAENVVIVTSESDDKKHAFISSLADEYHKMLYSGVDG